MELLGERPRCSIPDRMPVYHGDRHHFHACVRDKTLVRLMDRFDPEMSFLNRQLCFLREFKYDVACDPVQQAARKCRGTEAASSDEEEVADGAFRQMRFPIEENAVKGTGRDRFPFGLNVVQKISGFDLRIKSG